MKSEILIERLVAGQRLDREGYAALLQDAEPAVTTMLGTAARTVAQRLFGTGIYMRGLIELTNYCRNDCYYCGIRRSNRSVERYRLSKEDVMECCRVGDELGFRTFVLQGGEDMALSDRWIAELVGEIRAAYPDTAITLSLGERSPEAYRMFYEAGANRYLLRHETACEDHYGVLHPRQMSYESRMASLRALKEIGYQVGTGMMVGAPSQTVDNLVDDIMFIEAFRPEMIGLGPFIPQKDTPFANEAAGSVETTLRLIAIFRLMFPGSLIPSTTSLATIAPDGRNKGILAGANVVMPNLTPPAARVKYALYDNKASFGAESAEGLAALKAEFESIGYHLSEERGDYRY